MKIAAAPHQMPSFRTLNDSNSPPPPAPTRGEEFVRGADLAADGLLKFSGRLVGTSLAFQGARLALSAFVPDMNVVISGSGAGPAAVGVLVAAAGVGFLGWKLGGKATDAALRAADRAGQDHPKTKAVAKSALAVGLASMASVTFNQFELSLGLPAAGYIVGRGLLHSASR